MRISIVIGPFFPFPPVLGGAVEKAHLALAQAFRAAGHEVTVISRRYKDFLWEETVGGIRYIRIPSFSRHSSLLSNLILGLCYSVRAIFALPPSDVTVTNEFFLPMILPRRKAGKIYVQVGRHPKHQMWLYSRADRLQAVSREVGNSIARQTPWLAKKVSVIGYAISDAYFKCMQPLQRDKVVLYVGRIAKEKGIDLLIQAFVLLRERSGVSAGWQLRVVGPHEISQGGDGEEYLLYLKSKAEVLGPGCQFAEPIFDQDALIREYQRSFVFVYPSLAEFGEALGVAPLEAMASGCAALVSNLRCFDDFIEDGVTGLVFDQKSENAAKNLAAKLGRLMADPVLLEQIARAGHEAARRFQAESIAAKMLDDFRSLAGW